MTHTLRLLCKFSRADDALYPSSFKAACHRLFRASSQWFFSPSTPASFHKVTMDKRKSRSIGRRSSILKIDINKDEDTGILCKGRKSSRRVSFAETYQVKEFPRDSPQVWKQSSSEDEDDVSAKKRNGGEISGSQTSITGLDKLLTGAIQSQVYENIAEYPIPEMSSDSLNMSKLFDVNRTVLGPVDMDTTDVVGSEEIEFPGMDFGQEFSTEIKFDSASFLSNLRGKPSDRLQGMQIYSPLQQKENLGISTIMATKSDRSPLKGLTVVQDPSDDTIIRENQPLEPTFHLFGNENDPSGDVIIRENQTLEPTFHLFGNEMDLDKNSEQEKENKIDAKSFLTNLFGPKQDSTVTSTSLYSQDRMDANNLDVENMEETTCYGGMVGKDAVKDLTIQITAEMEKHDQHTMEETRCLGGIVSQDNTLRLTGKELYNDTVADRAVGMEETACLGGIINRTKVANQQIEEATALQTGCKGTRMLNDEQTDHEINTIRNVPMEETQCLGDTLKEGDTKELYNKGQSSDTTIHKIITMEETECIGSISNRNSTFQNRESTYQRKNFSNDISNRILSDKLNTSLNPSIKHQDIVLEQDISNEINKTIPISEITANQTVAMDETKCQGGIVNNTNITRDFTKNVSYSMEETNCFGGILNQNNDQDLSVQIPANKMAASQSELMKGKETIEDERSKRLTKDLTGLVMPPQEPTINQTVMMEETNCVSNMIHKNTTRDISNLLSDQDYAVKQIVTIDETKSANGIINENVTKDLTSLRQAHENTINQTVMMEETKCLGGMINKNVTKDLASLRQAHDNTVNQTVMMEETKCLGEMINKNVSKDLTSLRQGHDNTVNQAVMMEETKCLGGMINKNVTAELTSLLQAKNNTGNKTIAMDETKCVGGMINENVTKDLTSLRQAHDNTVNQTVMMEETKCLGGMINKNVTKDFTNQIKAHENTVNQTVMMEETKCLGGMINKNVTKDLTNQIGAHDNTVSHTVLMEVTKCVGGFIDTGNNTTNESSHLETLQEKIVNQTVMMEETGCLESTGKQQEARCFRDETKDINVSHQTTDSRHSTTERRHSIDSVVNSVEITDANIQRKLERDANKVDSENVFFEKQDNEISFKKSPKEQNNSGDEVTRDVTQSHTRQFQKLKELLILSKKKTPSHLKRPAEPTSSVIHSSQKLMGRESQGSSLEMRSPAHKKKRLFNNDEDLNFGEKLASASDLDYNIDDEQMPDFMKAEAVSMTTLTSVASDDTHVNENDTIRQKLSPVALTSSLIDTRCNDEQQSDIRTERLSSVTLNSDDTSSSGGKDASMLQRQSFLSFNNESCLSFICPNGNISLEMFRKKMTVKPCMLVKSSGRRSSLFTPKIDSEDMGEVIQAELIMVPMVKATQRAYQDIKDRIIENEETSAQLQDILEETQPQIFQDCASLEGSELHALRDQVLGLHRTCYKLGKLHWTERTKQAVSETLQVVQEEGHQHVNEILEKIRSNTRKTNNFIQSIDDDLLEFEETTKQLEELEEQKRSLEREMENLQLQVKETEKVKNEVSKKLEEHKQEENVQEIMEDLKQQLKMHLILQEWNLDSLDDHCAVFTFLDGELDLKVTFDQIAEQSFIQSVNLYSHISPGCVKASKRLAHSMALAGISTEKLKKYTTKEDLRLLLHEVSNTVSEIRHFCSDFHWLQMEHIMKVDHRRIMCDFWSLQTLDEIHVELDFSPSSPLTSPADVNVHVLMGTIRPEKIIEELKTVKPGRKYLSRLFSAIKFQ